MYYIDIVGQVDVGTYELHVLCANIIICIEKVSFLE